MANKYPWLQFYPGDWLKDPKLSMCSPATRGIWIDAISAMHESDTATISGSPDQLSRVLRCSVSDLQSAMAELSTTGAADVRNCNGIVTLISKRRQKEEHERLMTLERVKKHRCNASVTPHMSYSTKKSDIKKKEVKEKEKICPHTGTKPPDAGPPPAFINLTRKGVWENITKEHRRRWGEAYPGVDVSQELKQMASWVLADWAHHKKIKWESFIVRWLKRTQDSGGTKQSPGIPVKHADPLPHFNEDTEYQCSHCQAIAKKPVRFGSANEPLCTRCEDADFWAGRVLFWQGQGKKGMEAAAIVEGERKQGRPPAADISDIIGAMGKKFAVKV